MPWCVSCVSAEDTNCCYLGTDIFKGGRADKWKANQEHILKKNNNRRTLITLPRQHWHSFNAPVDAATRTDLDSGWMRHGFHFPSLWPVGTRPVCCKDKRAETRALSLPPAGPQTVYRYYGYKALSSVHALSDEERQKENSLCVDSVTLKLLNLQWQL